jgi:hypothetical protein
MNALREEALNVLLCFVLGAALGGSLCFFRGDEVSSAQPSLAEAIAEPTDQDAGVQAMQGIEDAEQRRFALLNNLTRLAVTDLDEALALLPADASHDAVLREWITLRLMKTRPDLASRAASAMRDPSARLSLMSQAVMKWRDRDAAAAGTWLRSVLDEPLANELATTSMGTNPAFIAQVLAQWNGASARDACLSTLLARWATLDCAEAFRFVQTLPAAQITPRMIQGVGCSLLALPTESVQLWLASLPRESQKTVMEDMASMLAATTTLPHASELMTSYAAFTSGSDAQVQWFASLATAAPAEAQRLLDSAPSDALAIGCVRSLGVRDRATALEWTTDISDIAQREEEARDQFTAWLREDRTKALQWLRSEAAKVVLGSELQTSLATHYSSAP